MERTSRESKIFNFIFDQQSLASHMNKSHMFAFYDAASHQQFINIIVKAEIPSYEREMWKKKDDDVQLLHNRWWSVPDKLVHAFGLKRRFDKCILMFSLLLIESRAKWFSYLWEILLNA